MQNPKDSYTETTGTYASTYGFTWSCNGDDSGTSVLVGFTIGGGEKVSADSGYFQDKSVIRGN